MKNNPILFGQNNHSSVRTEDFLDIQTLHIAEEFFIDKTYEVAKSKLEACIILFQIQRKELYKEKGYPAFKDYILANNLPIAYNTALEYSKIGELFVAYQKELSAIEFKEEMGLKKLLILPKALENHDKSEVFSVLKENSYQKFKKYSQKTIIEQSSFEEDNVDDFPQNIIWFVISSGMKRLQIFKIKDLSDYTGIRELEFSKWKNQTRQMMTVEQLSILYKKKIVNEHGLVQLIKYFGENI